MQSIVLEDALVESVGCSGEAHLLMMGYKRMKGLDWPVMWRNDPSIHRLLEVWHRALTSGRGLDLTARQLKVCVSRDMCELKNGALAKQLMFAGYTSGSTLGAGCLMLAFMLSKCKASPWQLEEVQAFLVSIARIKVTFVVHESPQARVADAWRIKASGQQQEEHHCLMAANMLLQAHAYEANWTWTAESLRQAIEDLNNSVGTIRHAKIGSWKERSVQNIILYMPEQVVAALQASYMKTGWERSYMNEDLLRQPYSRPLLCGKTCTRYLIVLYCFSSKSCTACECFNGQTLTACRRQTSGTWKHKSRVEKLKSLTSWIAHRRTFCCSNASVTSTG